MATEDIVKIAAQFGSTGLLGFAVTILWNKYQASLDTIHKLQQDRIEDQTRLIELMSGKRNGA
jgi:hypothetical protein